MKSNKQTTEYILGVDEVGRGPLAGPVMVGLALVPVDFDWVRIPGVTDSKKLTPEKRTLIYERATALQAEGQIEFVVAAVSAHTIDSIGIAPSITSALKEAFETLEIRRPHRSEVVDVRLDGGLKAPEKYRNQTTIIKGDLHDRAIGLASVIAKVTRDRYMIHIAQAPDLIPYNFSSHKGYGTQAHRTIIKKIGLSHEHRASFCRSVLTER